MDPFFINEIKFIVDNDNNVILDRTSPILKHRFIHTNNRNEELQKTKSIILKITECITICNALNEHYKKFRCLENIEVTNSSISISEELKTTIYNTLDKNVTRNIFSIHDIEFLKRLVKTKLESYEKFSSESSNNPNIQSIRNIQLQKLSKFRK